MILYSQLRQKTLQTLRGASKVTPKVEWEFVLHSARLYDRMGCDLLGLDLGWYPLVPFPFPAATEFVRPCLFGRANETDQNTPVRNWEFLHPGTSVMPGLGGEMDPLKLLRRRSSLVVADLPVSPVSPVSTKLPSDMKSGGRPPVAPTVFEEPDSNSLLDSFGF